MIDIKKLKENAEHRNFTLDENEGMKWSRVRMGRIISNGYDSIDMVNAYLEGKL